MGTSKIKSSISKILIVFVIALLYVGTMWFYRRNTTEVAQVPETEIPTQSENQGANIYKSGVYSSAGSYISPGGSEPVNLTLTIQNDVVTAADFTAEATVPASEFFQKEFIANYKTQVIGKSLKDLNLTKVSGSSLTPKGFNDAVAKIKAQAEL